MKPNKEREKKMKGRNKLTFIDEKQNSKKEQIK